VVKKGIPRVLITVYIPRVLITVYIPRVWKKEVYPGCGRRRYTQGVERGTTMRRVAPVLPLPFPVSLLGIPHLLVHQCFLWRDSLLFLPVSLLVDDSCSPLPTRFTVGHTSHTPSTRFTVGEIPRV